MIGGVYGSIRIEAKLQSAFNLTEGGSWTYDVSGATTTSTTSHTSYLDTSFNPLSNLTRVDTSYSYYWVNTHNYTPSNDIYFAGAYSAQLNMWATNPYTSSPWQYIAYANGQNFSLFNPTTLDVIKGGNFISSQINISGTDRNTGYVNGTPSSVVTLNASSNLPNSN